LKIKEGIKRIKDENDRLEPMNGSSGQPELKNFLKSSLWCTIWENVGTYLTSPDNPKMIRLPIQAKLNSLEDFPSLCTIEDVIRTI
jgi:hypothetical protein